MDFFEKELEKLAAERNPASNFDDIPIFDCPEVEDAEERQEGMDIDQRNFDELQIPDDFTMMFSAENPDGVDSFLAEGTTFVPNAPESARVLLNQCIDDLAEERCREDFNAEEADQSETGAIEASTGTSDCSDEEKPSDQPRHKAKSRNLVEFGKQLAQYFHLPRGEAARQLGICETMLKRRCRRLGIKKWPYRKMKSLELRVKTLQSQLQDKRGSHCPPSVLQAKLESLERRKQRVKENPNISFTDLLVPTPRDPIASPLRWPSGELKL